MIGAILIVNLRADLLFTRNYRANDLSRGVPAAFRQNVIAAKETRSPVLNIGTTSLMFIKSENIYIIAVTALNANVAEVFETLHKIAEILRAYFHPNKLNEEAIRNNLILTMELLDEIVDWGYPQNTTVETVKSFITQKGAVKGEKLKSSEKVSRMTNQITGASPWRGPDIKYKKNEIYIDIIESVNLLVSTDGKKLRADVSGKALMRCYLSGMPECKFGLNDKVMMDKEKTKGPKKASAIAIDDCTFHQCVRLGKFETDRTISFIPPDGEFELMKYRTTENIEIPFHITPIVKEHSKTRLEVKVVVKANYKRDLSGKSVKVKIPLPKNTAVCKVYTQAGKGKYYPEVDAIVWKIKNFPGDTQYILGAEVELSSSVSAQKKAWSRPPISMEFQVPFTASSLLVRFLKVLEQKQQYQAIKWVRYLTQAGSYQYRI